MSYYELSEFKGRFDTSHEYVARVAYWIARDGKMGVICPPPRVRAETESRHKFEATTDVVAYVGETPEQRRKLSIEVKSKNVKFTTPESWPFDDVTLYNANKTSDPYAVVLCSTITEGALVVVRDETWFKGMQQDRDAARNGLEYEVWKAPVAALLSWDAFLAKLWLDLTGKTTPRPRSDLGLPPPKPVTPHVSDDLAHYLTQMDS